MFLHRVLLSLLLTAFSQATTEFPGKGTQVNLVDLHLSGVKAVTVSPRGDNVYAASSDASKGTLTSWDRNMTTGALTNQVDFDNARLTLAQAVAVSPDGRTVYVAAGAYHKGSLVWFARNDVSGVVYTGEDGKQRPDGTYNRNGKYDTCGVPGCGGLYDVVVSPDGKNVYAVGHQPGHQTMNFPDQQGPSTYDRVISWQRQLVCQSCDYKFQYYSLSDQTIHSWNDNLGGATGLAISPDGQHLYVAAMSSDAVVGFTR